MDERDALKAAVEAAKWSPCRKSKRGVVIWMRGYSISDGCNAPALGYQCDGSEACRKSCGQRCIHAEMAAIFNAIAFGKPVRGAEMLHIKVVDGKPVPSGPPSCPDCSKHILTAGIAGMWLLHPGEVEPELRRYTAAEFHAATLRTCGIHPFPK